MKIASIYRLIMRSTKFGGYMFFIKLITSVLVGILGLCLISYPTPQEGVMKINSMAKLTFTALLLLTAMVYVFWFIGLLQFALTAIWIKRQDLDKLNSILEECKNNKLDCVDLLDIITGEIYLQELKERKRKELERIQIE